MKDQNNLTVVYRSLKYPENIKLFHLYVDIFCNVQIPKSLKKNFIFQNLINKYNIKYNIKHNVTAVFYCHQVSIVIFNLIIYNQ